MTYRLRHRPRAACQLPGVVDSCLSFGAEVACRLCDMIDFTHPMTCATVGRFPALDPAEARESPFWAHLERRSDGGPRTPAELERANARRREHSRSDQAGKVRAAVIRRSPLPIEPPF